MNSWLIIASGESARETLFKAHGEYKGRINIMTINSSWRLCPVANVHYSNDGDWYQNELPKMAAARGEKYCGDPLRNIPGTRRDYLFHKNSRGLDMRPGCLAWGGNSGYAGINLAAQLGAKKIVLVGYDMCGNSHWHGEHDATVKKPFNFPMWIPRFRELAEAASRRGITILNASKISKLECFQYVDISEGLKWLGE